MIEFLGNACYYIVVILLFVILLMPLTAWLYQIVAGKR